MTAPVRQHDAQAVVSFFEREQKLQWDHADLVVMYSDKAAVYYMLVMWSTLFHSSQASVGRFSGRLLLHDERQIAAQVMAVVLFDWPLTVEQIVEQVNVRWQKQKL